MTITVICCGSSQQAVTGCQGQLEGLVGKPPPYLFLRLGRDRFSWVCVFIGQYLIMRAVPGCSLASLRQTALRGVWMAWEEIALQWNHIAVAACLLPTGSWAHHFCLWPSLWSRQHRITVSCNVFWITLLLLHSPCPLSFYWELGVIFQNCNCVVGEMTQWVRSVGLTSVMSWVQILRTHEKARC